MFNLARLPKRGPFWEVHESHSGTWEGEVFGAKQVAFGVLLDFYISYFR
jgi:hypothetical protein